MKYKCISLELAQTCASPFRFKRGIEAAVGAAIVSGLAGMMIADETNEANAEAVGSTNNANLQAVRETNATNIKLQEQANEYNSIGAQIQRGRDAGVNPNSIIGGDVAGNLQTSVPLQEAFKALAPHFENPSAQFTQNLQGIASAIADTKKSYSETRRNELLGDYQSVVNQYVDTYQKLGIDVNKSVINKNVADASNAWVSMQNSKADIMRIQAMVKGMDLDNYDKMMRNIFSKDFYEQAVRSAMATCHVNEVQAQIMVARLPYEIGLLKGQTNAANQSAYYMRKMGELTDQQKKVLEAQEGFINAQTFRQWLDNNFFQDTSDITESEMRARAKSAWYNSATDAWHSTPMYQFSEWFNNVTGSMASAVGAYAGAKGALKNPMSGVGQGSYHISPNASPTLNGSGWFANGY